MSKGKRKPKGKNKGKKPSSRIVSDFSPRPTATQKKWSAKTWVIVLGVVALISGVTGIIVNSHTIHENSLSTHDKWFKDTHDSGTIDSKTALFEYLDSTPEYTELKTRPILSRAIPDKYPPVRGVKVINDKKHWIDISIGHGVWALLGSVLEKGIEIFTPDISGSCYETSLKLVLKDDRIYVSAKFVDLIYGEEVGFMDYNHWEVLNQKVMNYNPADDRLEVIDRQGYVIFSMIFTPNVGGYNGCIALSGYFISPHSVLVVNSPRQPMVYTNKEEGAQRLICVPKEGDWKTPAEDKISKIHSVFTPDTTRGGIPGVIMNKN